MKPNLVAEINGLSDMLTSQTFGRWFSDIYEKTNVLLRAGGPLNFLTGRLKVAYYDDYCTIEQRTH